MPTQFYVHSLIVATAAVCLLGGPGCGKKAALPIGLVDAAAESEAGSEAGADAALIPGCPPSCDDHEPCTVDSCDTAAFQCLHVPLANGTSCQGTPCSTIGICSDGLCLEGPSKECIAKDQCHVAGLCDSKTGECTNPVLTNGAACDDGNRCTYGDKCQEGVCAGALRVCPNGIQCDQDSGSCSVPVFPDALSSWALAGILWPSNGNALVRDPAGHVFVAGAFYDKIDLGTGVVAVAGTKLVGPSYTNVFLALIDPVTTKAAWVQSYPGPASQRQLVTSFAANGAGQIGMIGDLGGGSLTVAGTELVRVREADQFIMGANAADGTGLWGWRLNLQNGDTKGSRGVLRAIAGDPKGTSFMVCGHAVCGTGTSPPGGMPPSPAKDFSPSLGCAGGVDVVVARIDVPSDGPDGGSAVSTLRDATVWANQIGGTNDEECTALAMDAASSTLIVGTYKFGSKLTFGNLAPLSIVGGPADKRMFLAKLDSKNQWVWAKDIGSEGQSVQADTMMVVDGDVVLAGRITNGSLHKLLGLDLASPAFVARISGSTGNVVWLRSVDAGFDTQSAGVQVAGLSDAGGNILMVGNYAGAYTLGGIPMPKPSALTAAFVAQLDGATGAVIAARGYGDPSPKNGSKAAGILGLVTAGSRADGSLLLLTLTGQLDFGPPVGVLQSVSETNLSTSVTKLNP